MNKKAFGLIDGLKFFVALIFVAVLVWGLGLVGVNLFVLPTGVQGVNYTAENTTEFSGFGLFCIADFCLWEAGV